MIDSVLLPSHNEGCQGSLSHIDDTRTGANNIGISRIKFQVSYLSHVGKRGWHGVKSVPACSPSK